jgi:hypothetical protein
LEKQEGYPEQGGFQLTLRRQGPFLRQAALSLFDVEVFDVERELRLKDLDPFEGLNPLSL